jgi:signal transduction histidine kinase
MVTSINITEKKELDEIKSNLLTRFSHEFKTPLISIRGFSDLLLTEYAEILDKKVISFLNRIKTGGNRLANLVNSFIESSQLNGNRAELKLNQNNLSALIRDSLKYLEGHLRMRDHTINLEIQENLVLEFDEDKIYTVITNLILNAINYTPIGGTILISSKVKRGSILISIKDSGIGLSKKDKSHLFEPFGKIERYGKGWDILSEGMGMGLYISKEFIDLHKGKLWAESEGRNKGSTFIFSIPIVN